jgi:hypothetical protein
MTLDVTVVSMAKRFTGSGRNAAALTHARAEARAQSAHRHTGARGEGAEKGREREVW